MWEESLELMLKVAASHPSRSLGDSAVAAVEGALNSLLLGRNSNEALRLEAVHATLRARYIGETCAPQCHHVPAQSGSPQG